MVNFYYSIEFLEYRKSDLINFGSLLLSSPDKLTHGTIKDYIRNKFRSNADVIILNKVKPLHEEIFAQISETQEAIAV